MLFLFIIISYTVEVVCLIVPSLNEIKSQNNEMIGIYDELEVFLSGVQRDVKRSKKIMYIVGKYANLTLLKTTTTKTDTNAKFNKTKTMFESAAISAIESSTGPITEFVKESITESITDSITDSITESPTEWITMIAEPRINITEDSYFTDNLERLFNVLAAKSFSDMFAVTKHFEDIYDSAIDSGRFPWLGRRMRMIIVESIPISVGQQVWSKLMSFWIKHRREQFGLEQNELFDLANHVLKKEDGDHLKELIEEFNDYPATNRKGKDMCRELFEAFARPFEMKRTTELNKLIENVQDYYVYRGAFYQLRRYAMNKPNNEELHRIDNLMISLREKIKETRDALIDVNLRILSSPTPAQLRQLPQTTTRSSSLATRCTRGKKHDYYNKQKAARKFNSVPSVSSTIFPITTKRIGTINEGLKKLKNSQCS